MLALRREIRRACCTHEVEHQCGVAGRAGEVADSSAAFLGAELLFQACCRAIRLLRFPRAVVTRVAFFHPLEPRCQCHGSPARVSCSPSHVVVALSAFADHVSFGRSELLRLQGAPRPERAGPPGTRDPGTERADRLCALRPGHALLLITGYRASSANGTRIFSAHSRSIMRSSCSTIAASGVRRPWRDITAPTTASATWPTMPPM